MSLSSSAQKVLLHCLAYISFYIAKAFFSTNFWVKIMKITQQAVNDMQQAYFIVLIFGGGEGAKQILYHLLYYYFKLTFGKC